MLLDTSNDHHVATDRPAPDTRTENFRHAPFSAPRSRRSGPAWSWNREYAR